MISSILYERNAQIFKDFDMKSNRIRINFLCEDITGLYASIPNRNIPNLIDAFKKNELN